MCCGSHCFGRTVFFSLLSLRSKSMRLPLSTEHLNLARWKISHRHFPAFPPLPILKLKDDSRRCYFSSEKRSYCSHVRLEPMAISKRAFDTVVPNDIACLNPTSETAFLQQVQHGGSEACSSSLLRSKKRLKQPQLTVAVDIDEVLGSFLTALNTFVAEKYFLEHTVSEYHVYDFTEVWRCSRAEADMRVHSFFKSEHFDKGILPIPGAYQSLLQILSFCQLFVVTSRQNIIKEATLAWIERHFSGIFREVHFGNHFALEGEARSKSEICRCVGAQVLVDDNPVYAMDCAANGIEVLLFDYNRSYPWTKTPEGPIHPSITRVHNWEEVERALQARSKIMHRQSTSGVER